MKLKRSKIISGNTSEDLLGHPTEYFSRIDQQTSQAADRNKFKAADGF